MIRILCEITALHYTDAEEWLERHEFSLRAALHAFEERK